MLVTFGVICGVAGANIPSLENGLIAFQRNADAAGQIWVMDPTAAAPEAGAVQVTTGTEPEAQPAYGPAESVIAGTEWKLAFQRFTGGNWDIWSRATRQTAGERPQFDAAVQIVSDSGDQTEPAYSRFSPWAQLPLLAYISDQTGRREIWLQDTAGTKRQLTSDGAGYAHPDFAGRYRPAGFNADGTVSGYKIGLAFESTRGGRRAIWALDIEFDSNGAFVGVRDLRPVVSGPQDLFEPSWQTVNDFEFGSDVVHSRVNNVLFATAQAGATYLDYVEEPWTQRAEDGSVTPAVPFADPAAILRFALTGDPGGDGSPVWAPFGDQVALSRTTAGNSDIWVTLANGTGQRRLTSSAAAELHPSWQPKQESSADKVGGHTHPGPVARKGAGGGAGTGGSSGTGSRPTGTAKRPAAIRGSPRLKIDRARWRARTVRVSGRTASRLAGPLRVTFSCGRRTSQRNVRRVTSKRGRFTATLRVGSSCRRARRGTVIVTYRGDSLHKPGRVSRRVRRH